MRSILLALAAFAIGPSTTLAQDSLPTAADHARLRAQCYAQAVGMDPKAVKKLEATLLPGEESVLDLRNQLKELEARIDSAMAPYDAAVEKQLNKEQKTRLESLKVTGWMPCSEPCTVENAGQAGCVRSCCSQDGTPAVKPAKPGPPPAGATLVPEQ
jgi:hypothetical protein